MLNYDNSRDGLTAVTVDDALLNSLSGQRTDMDLVRALGAWRRDVYADPIGEMPELDSALAEIGAQKRSERLARVRNVALGAFLLSLLVLLVLRWESWSPYVAAWEWLTDVVPATVSDVIEGLT